MNQAGPRAIKVILKNELTEESDTVIADLTVKKVGKEPFGRSHGASPASPDVAGAVVS